jgi:hypothetical protein
VSYQITITRFVSPPQAFVQKAIVHAFHTRAMLMPVSVTDDAGNTYTMHSKTLDAMSWYVMKPESREPTIVTLTFRDGRNASYRLD